MNPPRSEDPPPVSWHASDGETLLLRPIRADDATLISAFVRGLSFGARYFRFGRGDYDLTEEEVVRLCSPNPDACVHLLVLQRSDEGEAIVGSARIVFEAGSPAAELAITVKDEWQARGVGKRLVDALLANARQRGLAEVHARILGTNAGMIEFMHRCGFAVEDSAEGAWLKVARMRL